MSGEVLLGFVSAGTIRAEFMNSVLNAVSGPDADPAIGGVISSSAGPLLALGRNLLVQQFLGKDHEWLCCVDTDIVFSTDSVSRLLEVADPVDLPVVSALYHVFWDGKKIPAAYKATIDSEGSMTMNYIDPVPESSVMRVDAVGAGFMMVHRSVFENIQKRASGQPAWFRESVIGGRDHGEDISFCLRCAGVSARIYLHTGVQVGHIKSAMLGEVT
jgi:GT2 family glycosyltransferase